MEPIQDGAPFPREPIQDDRPKCPTCGGSQELKRWIHNAWSGGWTGSHAPCSNDAFHHSIVEPIQDDIEMLRTALDNVVGTNPRKVDAIAALDRLVAERDRYKSAMGTELITGQDRIAELVAERDRLRERLGMSEHDPFHVGEPIQDDIETLRTILNWVWATNPSTGSAAHHNAQRGREALDRLVAKLAGTEAERRGLEIERDRLLAENKRFIELTDSIQAENERMVGIVDSYVASGPTNQEARDFGIEAHNKLYALEQGIGALVEKWRDGTLIAGEWFADELEALTKKSEA